MAGVPVEAGSALAQAIQGAVQPKLIENGWVAEENDTTLSEYVTMMMVNGKDLQGVAAELGGDLLGVGEDDQAVMAFAEWLFQELQSMAGQSQTQQPQVEMQNGNGEQSVQDAPMDDAMATGESIPSGPKAMRNGGSGRGARGGRILGQLNSHMNREQSLPDPLRRIKGAAGGHGRIDSHRGTPRGPRGGASSGIQRMANGGRGSNAAMNQMNPMMPQGNMNQLNPQQQMAFMQMMEMQATMMSQIMQNGGQMPAFGQQPNGNHGKSLFDRVDKRGGANGHFKGQRRNQSTTDGDSTMDLDSALTDTPTHTGKPFDTPCRFNHACTNPACPFAHQSPAASPGQAIDLTDTCSFGIACENRKCTGRHPSPAQRNVHHKTEVDCKFFPNCNNPACPFRHPDMPLCRNGADCAVPGCKFTHSKIACRYKPCTKPGCPFKHAEGQKGVFKDKVWTAEDGVPEEGENGGVAERFAGFKESEGGVEELILPGQAKQEEGMVAEAATVT